MTPDEREQLARAQVWEAVRLFSDAEREHVQQLLLASRSTAPRNDAVQISLTLARDSRAAAAATDHDNQADNDGAVQPAAAPRITQWSPSDFVHALLGHLHHVAAHSQQQQQTLAPLLTSERSATATAADQDAATRAAAPSADVSSSSRRAAKATTSSSSSNRAFALLSDDFPSLVSSASPPAQAAAASTGGGSGPHKPQAKVTKRRITTTVVSEQSAITRPVLTPVAFPPLGSAVDASTHRSQSNPWAKRELLERRMMASAEPEAATPEPPALSPVLIKTRAPLTRDKAAETRDSSAAKKPALLFDDSPPGGPKRVQPFPVQTANHVAPIVSPDASCQSPVITTPVKSASAQPPPPMLLCVKPKRQRRQSLLASATSDNAAAANPPAPLASQSAAALPLKIADDFAVNTQAAKLYAFLITKRLVGSTCTELQLLISLLYRMSCTDASSCTCATPSEFCWRRHCVQFAAIVFDAIEPVLASLGAELLSLLLASLADAAICVELQARLQQTAQRREELRVAESARIGCRLPVETKASAVRDFALPFCEEVDSRLHYRSPTESVMYANRERVRDGFLDLLRQFQRQQHSLVGIENANVAAAAIASANTLLADVAPENRWWFAKFFVLELIQVGANPFGESDKDLVLTIMTDKLVVKNPDRLRKLHRRFSSQKQQQQQQQPSQKPANSSAGHQRQAASGPPSNSQGNGNKSHHHAGVSKANSGSGGSKTDRHDASAEAKAASAITATFETSREYFAEHQQFFFHFLHSCDSYAFSQLVKYQLEAQFHVLWRTSNSAGKGSDPRKAFTDVVLKLKVVTKFLGYLRFSPHWHNSAALQLQVAQQNPAFQAAKREAVATLESAESVGLDVKRLLEQSVETATLSKCVPWLCDYLTMLSLDKLSLDTTYFRQLLVLLARIYHSPRLDALGETGLYIALQIERVCHVLDVDIAGFLDDPTLRVPQLQPRASVLLALDSDAVGTSSSATKGHVGEDTLPFLHSQVFVQSCVSELEDLRGFLQTRAQPSHRVTKRGDGDAHAATGTGRSASNRQSIPIRKLRPLQVVTEDDGHHRHRDELFAQTDAAASASPSLSTGSSPSSSSSSSSSITSSSPASSVSTTAAAAATTTLSDDDRLADAIFKVHPALRKVVEFVVEVVATNICEHVVQHVVTPRADAFVRACASESKLSSLAAASAAAAELEAATILFLQLLENRTARTIHESASASLETAHALCDDRVRAAIPPLLPPACHATLGASVTLVALTRTRAVVKTLVPTSARSEFLKRTAVRKKAVLKETAPPKTSAPAASGTSSGSELSVVRTLSTMFDAHAGVDDDASSDDELVLALKQTSAQVWQLSRTSRATWQLDEWMALYASLARHVRSFANRLRELLQHDDDSDADSVDHERPSKAMRPEDTDERPHARKLHALPVWAAMWRVLQACLHVVRQLPLSVVEWTNASDTLKHQQSAAAAAASSGLEKTVNRFVDHVVALVELVGTTAASSSDHNDPVASRRIAKLCCVVRECVETPSTGAEQSLDTHELMQRLVLAPRMRLLAAVTSLGREASSSPSQEAEEEWCDNQKLEQAARRRQHKQSDHVPVR